MKEFILLILSGICLNVLFLVIGLIFPKRTEVAQIAAAEMPKRSFLLGLVNTVFFSAIILAFVAFGDATGVQVFSLFAVILLVIYVILLGLGLSSMTQILGSRLVADKPFNQQVLLGGAALILACFTPFLGWFLLFPYVGMTGVGGLIIGSYREKRLRVDSGDE